MLRLMCLSLLASASAFHILRGRNEPGNYHIQLVEYGELARQKHSLCLPTPFLRQICLPTGLPFFMPVQTLGAGGERCLTVPIMTAYVVKVCPRKETPETSSKAPTEELEAEAEKETTADKAGDEVNGGEAAPEYVATAERSRESEEESKARNKSAETGRNLIRVAEDRGVVEGSGFPEKELLEDENISIMSNYV